MLQSGCDIANVQALAGHKSIKTTQRYLGVSTQLRREAVNRLNLPDTKQGETLEKVASSEGFVGGLGLSVRVD